MLAKRLLVIAGVTVLLVGLLLRIHPGLRAGLLDAISPFMESRDEATWRMHNASDFNKSKVELVRELLELQAQVDSQNFAERQVELLQKENADLRQLLDLNEKLPYQLLRAQIQLRDPADGGRSYRIGVGSSAGVKPGYAVLNRGYLHGRVVSVSEHSAEVVTITDPQSRVSIQIAETDLKGILFGTGDNRWASDPRCEIRFLPRDASYMPGMAIETSSYDPLIPPAIPIGELVGFESEGVVETVDALYKQGRVRLHAFDDEADFVMVILTATRTRLLQPVPPSMPTLDEPTPPDQTPAPDAVRSEIPVDFAPDSPIPPTDERPNE